MAVYVEHIAPFLRFEVPIPNMLYAFGGRVPFAGSKTLQRSTGVVLDTVDMLDTWHGRWVQTSPMPIARAGGAAACLPDGRILVTGGYDERGVVEGVLDRCDAYNPYEERWEPEVSRLQRARWGHAVAQLGERLYAVGGCSKWAPGASRSALMETLRTCEVYTPTAAGSDWEPAAPLQIARSGVRVVTLNDRYMAAIGGCEDPFGRVAMQATVELYDALNGHWALLGPRLVTPRTCASTVALEDGRIVVAGGSGSTEGIATSPTEVYEVLSLRPSQDKAEEVVQVPLEGVRGTVVANDPLGGRVGCQAAAIRLPGPGCGYPHSNNRCLLAVGGERVDKQADESLFGCSFDLETGSWRQSLPFLQPRAALALCVGLGRVIPAHAGA